jgi:outer membrane biosynthesis protein TonB
MANNKAIADFLHAWEKMVTNVIANAAELPDMSVNRDALQKVLEAAKARVALVASRRGVKQQEVKDQQELMRQGRFEFSRLRGALIAHYGPFSERLLDYGITPFRPRPRSKGQPKPGQPTPEQPKPEEVKPEEVKPVKAEAEQPKAEEPKPANPAPAPEVKPAPQGS